MSDAQLSLAAEILGPLCDEVVFVGGATIHLWLTRRGRSACQGDGRRRRDL